MCDIFLVYYLFRVFCYRAFFVAYLPPIKSDTSPKDRRRIDGGLIAFLCSCYPINHNLFSLLCGGGQHALRPVYCSGGVGGVGAVVVGGAW